MNKVTIDVGIPETVWNRYDPAEDAVACTSCLICGESITLMRYEHGPKVCNECKRAVLAMREKKGATAP